MSLPPAALLLFVLEGRAGELPFVGERLYWEVSYAGVSAGTAWAEARAGDGGVVFEAGCRNASWYEPIYVVNDLVRSTWLPGAGSLRYQTWFREGRFHQDQDMRLSADGIDVWRRHLRDGAWEESTKRYPAAPGAEDPISALYALRHAEGEGPWTLTVWNGKKALTVIASAGQEVELETALGVLPARRISLAVPHQGEVEQKGEFVLWLGTDPARLPLRAELHANVGTFRAELMGWRDEQGRAWGATETGDP